MVMPGRGSPSGEGDADVVWVPLMLVPRDPWPSAAIARNWTLSSCRISLSMFRVSCWSLCLSSLRWFISLVTPCVVSIRPWIIPLTLTAPPPDPTLLLLLLLVVAAEPLGKFEAFGAKCCAVGSR